MGPTTATFDKSGDQSINRGPFSEGPEQFDRWSQIVAIVHNLIMVARDFVEAELRPWENKQREHTPQQVRRGLATLYRVTM
ncbi:MAG TPA: hypothetical protein VN207_08170 [Ktedonobacteraceae bacterium]|nr:hypothetical protein [Ktedonobacteraceae bacterium]